MAERLKMSIGECLEKHTERQIEAWLAHFRLGQENPWDQTVLLLQEVVKQVALGRGVRVEFSTRPAEKSDFKPTPQMMSDMALATSMGPEACRKLWAERKAKMKGGR